MPPGVIVLLAALAVAVIAGGFWRVQNGRVRDTSAVPAGRRGHLDTRSRGRQDHGSEQMPRVTTDQIGHALGERATLLQFSSAFCAPCRATRRILTEVAGLVHGVAHVEIDAESRLDLVRQLGVLRTPTVLVLAADGSVVRRASGQPRKADVIAAVGAAVQAGLDQAAATVMDSAGDPGK